MILTYIGERRNLTEDVSGLYVRNTQLTSLDGGLEEGDD